MERVDKWKRLDSSGKNPSLPPGKVKISQPPETDDGQMPGEDVKVSN